MNIAIIGAAAGVGFEATKQALANGYNVTTLSRNQHSLPVHNNLKALKGSATNSADVISTIKNTDAVLITIGTKQKKKTTLFSDMAKAVVSAAEEINYDRPILVVSGFGVGNGYNYLGFFMKMIINLFLKDQYKDKQLMEKIFAQSNLTWEMVQPGILNNNPFMGKYKVFSCLFKGMKVGKISRSDVAHYMLLESIERKHINKMIVISY